MILVLAVPTHGLSLVGLLGYGLLGWRVYRRYRSAGLGKSDAWLVAQFIVYSKFAHVLGIARYC